MEIRFFWSIMFFNVIGNLGEGISVVELEKKNLKSERGLFIDWEEINSLAKKCDQIIDIILLGCKDKNLLKRYATRQEKYEACDMVIEMIDSSYWLIFSKDEQLMQRLTSKFNDIEFVNSDHWSDLE